MWIGVALVIMVAILGYGWLTMKNIDEVNKRRGPRVVARKEASVTDSSILLSIAGGASGEGGGSELNPNVSMSEYLSGDVHNKGDGIKATADEVEEDDDWGDSGINSELTQEILAFIDDVQKRTTELLAKPLTNPVAETIAQVLPSSAQATLNPSLRFTNYLCHVFSLDKWSLDSAARLKRSLLKILRIREFTPETEFHNPCLSAVVHDFVCPVFFCCSDLDLLRDPNLSKHVWVCSQCRNPFDRSAVEATLVQRVEEKAVSYSVQDVSCGKCGTVKAENAVRTCSCCSSFTLKCKESTQDEMRLFLLTNLVVAKFHQFEWLEHVVTSMI